MKKVELLSPAGNMKSLIYAVNNGADAVYVGGKNFGARAFSLNFTNNELLEAVKYCHLYDVKIYVTVNTVIFENEIESFLSYMKYLYEINVDAVIMQDLGMIHLVKKLIPNLEIHASTQMNIHNDEGLKLLKQMKVTRAVLAREMTYDEVKNLKTDIQKEIFIHGALCVSYSGQCLFSSLNGGRSGNRGKCVGSCRLQYDLDNIKNKYPLSTKELCTADNIKQILDLNIDSLKIEGRMKSPEYVGYITHVYRRLIDEYYSNHNPKLLEEEKINIAKLFNRKFTKGYLFNDDIYNNETPNHLGYSLGQVIGISKDKIKIKLNDTLYQEDGIRFNESHKGMIVNKLYNEKKLLINKSDNIVYVDNKINLKTKDSVNKTIDKNLINSINNMPSKKIPISFRLEAHINENLKLTIADNINKITIEGNILNKAINNTTTIEEIKTKLNKLGTTPFYLDKCEIILDDVFIPMSELNNLRRNLTTLLIEKRSDKINKVTFKYNKKIINKINNENSYLVRNENQLKHFLNKSRIYTENYELYKKYKNNNVYFKLPRIMNEYPNYVNENLLISELGGIYKYCKNNNVIADYPLNITNSETVNFLHELGVKISTLSPEINNFKEVEKYSHQTEKIVYGKPDLMILKRFNYNSKYLKDKKGNYFKIIPGKYTTILHHTNINLNEKGRHILLDEKVI